MNPTKHSEVSARARGGAVADYLEIHTFLDHTKSLCADGRHRILHNHWGVQNIVLPIFGSTIYNSDGRPVDVKDMCEEDHLLLDYRRKFIPTLADFVDSIDDKVMDSELASRIEKFHSEFSGDSEVSKLMLSPLMITGQLKSLLVTHNSWFINGIIPQIFDTQPVIKQFSISPATLFNAMNFEPWMDNGECFPPSARRIEKTIIKTEARPCQPTM